MSQGGHIRKRGQSWTAYYFVSDASAERRQRSKGDFRTMSEAQAYLTSTLASLHAGTYTEPSRLTVGSYIIDRWLPAIRASIRPSTWSDSRRNINNRIVPELAKS